MEEFQNRVKKKLADDLAAMLPDDVLEQMIERAFEEQFFKERVIPGEYNRREERLPSQFVAEVAKTAKPIFDKLVRNYVEDNAHVMKEALDKFIAEQNLLLLAMAAMHSNTHSLISSSMVEFFNHLRNNGMLNNVKY